MELVVFYTFTGNSKKYVEENFKDADIKEIVLNEELPKFKFFKSLKIMKLSKGDYEMKCSYPEVDFKKYDKVTIVGPVWNNHYAKPVIQFIEKNFKELEKVELDLIASSGSKKDNKITEIYNELKYNTFLNI